MINETNNINWYVDDEISKKISRIKWLKICSNLGFVIKLTLTLNFYNYVMEEREMFCGNCGAQIPDGSAVCPNCGAQLAAKSQAPQMNQAFQNAGVSANGAVGGSGNKFDVKKVGIIAAAVVAVIVLVLVLKGLFGGSKMDGTYVNEYGYSIIIDGSKMTLNIDDNISVVLKYKIKDDKIKFDPKSVEFTKETLDYFEDELDYDKDDIEEELEDYKEGMLAIDEDEDEDEEGLDFEYKEKKKIIEINSTKFYYAENYKVGPSGKYTDEDNDDVTISFKNGKATFDDDGDKETLTYYTYDTGKDVYVLFYGSDFSDSEFYDEYKTSKILISDDDEIVIGETTFEK